MTTPRDIRPQIVLPRDLIPLPLLLGAVGVVGVGLFLTLNAHRLAQTAPDTLAYVQNAPPPLILPTPQAIPVVAPTPPRAVVARSSAWPHAAPLTYAAPVPLARYAAGGPSGPLIGDVPLPPRAASSGGSGSALVIDLTNGGGANGTDSATAPADDAAHATLIRSLASLIPQGAVIAAVLETPLNSDRPGLARAIVAQDVRGFDGNRVLIPRGSRLIGESKAEAGAGLRRIQVMWTRLIRPDGVAIRIGSPASDTMGGAGIGGAVNTHLAERFASAVLQSALTVGVNVASALGSFSVGSGSGTLYLGLPGQASQIGQQIVPNTSRPATIKVREGARIAVFVAHDLDFSGTPALR